VDCGRSRTRSWPLPPAGARVRARLRVAAEDAALLRKRANLAAARLTGQRWRAQWEAARLFLTADGEAGKAWGNETLRWHPDERWLEVKLPAPLAHLANRPHGRYRLTCPVEFTYRGDEVAAQAAAGAIRYDITGDPASGRWYLDASWKTAPAPALSLEALREHPVVAVDVNAGHLAVAVVAADGNVIGAPATVPLDLAGLPATTRDGRPAGRGQHPHRHRGRAWRAGGGDRGPGLRRRPRGGTRAVREPALPRTAGPRVPPRRRGHPDREVPRPARPDDRQRGPVRSRRRPGLHLAMGRAALARPAAGAAPEGDRAPRGSAGDRATPDSATGPGDARQGTSPPRRRRHGQPRRDLGPPREPGPHPGSPPPHQAPGSHPAPRPGHLTGPRQATRRPRTVRGRRIARTISCYLS